MQSLALIASLLRSHPEQEQNLLRLLVNKFVRLPTSYQKYHSVMNSRFQGDTESSICARTSYYLLHILQEHPAMKTIIIQETTALIMRPTPPIGPSMAFHSQKNKHIRFSEDSKSTPQREKNVWRAHAQYYAAITFNQIVLSTSAADRAAARKLMDVYFQLFREVVGEREPDPADADDDATSTKEKFKDKGKEQIFKKGPQKRKGKEVRGAAGFAEVQDANAKLLGAILTGINRALPYAQFGGGDME
jgi:ribosome biogenesis protein MAK21